MPEARAEVARFDLSLPIEQSPTPPSSWYIDPSVFQREAETVFRRSWQPVGRSEQVKSPGEFITGEFLGQPYVITRDEEGQLRAFYNVCRHHAALIASGEGCAQEFKCPYHGWTYRLDGRLRRAPRLGGVEAFDRTRYGLVALDVQEWGPLLWLRLGTEGFELGQDLAPLAALTPPEDLCNLRFLTRKSYEIGCNWKVYVDNYLDGGYHVEHMHPGLASQLDLEGYRTTVHPHLVLQTCQSGGSSDGQGLDFAERVAGGAVYGWLYPNFMLNRYGPIMDTNWVVPLGPGRCLTVFDYYFEPDCTPDFIESSLAASHQVQLEDVEICESVQKGLASAGYDVGRYAPVIEIGEYSFHRWLAEDLA